MRIWPIKTRAPRPTSPNHQAIIKFSKSLRKLSLKVIYGKVTYAKTCWQPYLICASEEAVQLKKDPLEQLLQFPRSYIQLLNCSYILTWSYLWKLRYFGDLIGFMQMKELSNQTRLP